MILYHYTAVVLAESIFQAGISIGNLTRSDGQIDRNLIWLTTSANREGHGLPDGQSLVPDDTLAYAETLQNGPLKNRFMHNKKEIRLKVKIKTSDRKLIKFADYSRRIEKNHNLFTKMTGLSCLTSINDLTDAQLQEHLRTTITYEDTWWLYQGVVPPASITGVDFFCDGAFVPYDFEKHGRKALLESGLVVPSAEALSSLREIVPSAHKLDQPKAIVMCTGLGHPAMVMIRGGGVQAAFGIEDEELRVSEILPEKIENLRDWIRAHKEELLVCWEQAKERYKFFYPEG